MIKPKRLKPKDKVAMVSLSWGGIGDKEFIHKYNIAKKRMKDELELELIPMPHALKGTEYIMKHPQKRAEDLMTAFLDDEISAIFCAIGGDDTIRLLPYIDFQIIKDHPKIFMGYSDSTVNHFMMYKAGLISFYGPSIMCEFGEYTKMFDYTLQAVRKVLFQDITGYSIPSSPLWSKDSIEWKEENQHTLKKRIPEQHGYEILQGKQVVTGHLLGGCLDVFMMIVGTAVWPDLSQWQNAVLFFETSEDKPSPEFVKYTLRNLAAQGILRVIKGIVVGKPQSETYYEEYKEVIMQVVLLEEQLEDLVIFYNINIGHAMPIGILPYGVACELDPMKKTITLLEEATIM